MKKFLAYASMAAIAIAFTSCSDNGPLSKSSAKSALEDTQMFAKNKYVTEFNTGYYEVTESELDNLAKLKAAGVITYSIDEVTEYTDHTYGNYWTGYYTRTVETTHQFANVELTEEGKKLEIEDADWAPKFFEKYAKKMKDFEETMPAYMTASGDNATPATEEVAVEEVAVDDEFTDSVVVEEAVEVVEAPAPAPAKKADAKKDRNEAYNNALAKVSSESHNMLMGQVKLEKVILVQCTEDMFKEGTGKCTFIYTIKDKTPFGFIYSPLREGAYEIGNATFKYYTDLGWVVDDMNK